MIDRIVLHPKFTRSYRKRIAPDKQLSLRTRQRIELFKHKRLLLFLILVRTIRCINIFHQKQDPKPTGRV
ncbi:MAG: hypothetical protein UV63_C0033G0005 [Microgenomates group bacterium GW2011_GWC1_43_11]|nr:MAG: hypothetical protein UV63_C0033G0005 [Microgenomates group bacterium GW2011_GWC1_43_11]